MRLELTSLSPLSFQLAKVGVLVTLKRKRANPNEYREKIGSARDCFLAFIGQTKIGMVPISHNDKVSALPLGSGWRVESIEASRGLIAIETT